MLFAAIEKVAVENADGSLTIPKGALRDAIFATKDFAGLTGTLTLHRTGDCGAPVIAVYEITQADVDDGWQWPPTRRSGRKPQSLAADPVDRETGSNPASRAGTRPARSCTRRAIVT